MGEEETRGRPGQEPPYDGEQLSTRAELLPEEKVVGSADPRAQAEAILEDSLERTEVRTEEQGAQLEHRRSDETTG
jgi:hypothetical protein